MIRSYLSTLLFTTALVVPAAANAQDTASQPAPTTPPSVAVEQQANPAPPEQQQPEVSVPGGEQSIVIRGRRGGNQQRTSTQVVNVLSTEQIAKTGEGNIAGSLARVTGLSVVGQGFVYVRGLGDRYSLALLNGSPLPSPEPLKRVVPLDLFPTNVIASSLVQKSYSVNYPGEFGGGVINLTTKSAPEEPFLTIAGNVGYDSEVTGKLGYVYRGSDVDWTGFPDRDIPRPLQQYLSGNQAISLGSVDDQAIASSLVTPDLALLQRNTDMPVNWKGEITGGTSFDVGPGNLGIIAAIGHSTRYRTRDTIQQTASTQNLDTLDQDFERVITDSRVVANGLLGLGYTFGRNKLRLTNLFIRDSLKQARLGVGTKSAQSAGATFMQQDTAIFIRQLIDTQLVAELRPMDAMTLDLRGGYANTKRKSPDELSFEYFRSNQPADPFGGIFINRLNNGQQGSAEDQFSKLNEDLWSAGADLGYRFAPWIRATVGYAFADTKRRSEVRQFLFLAPSDFPLFLSVLRPDVLLSPAVIDLGDIGLVDVNEVNPIFDAKLRNHAGYGQLDLNITDNLNLVGGVRYETAKQTVTPVPVFEGVGGSTAVTDLDNHYWLPAATLTWRAMPQLQLRLSASKTIARPQFRELIFQPYTDPDSNRVYRGNPLLVDSTLKNAEARAEYYFQGEQHVAIAGFYKKIDKPIETFASFSDNAILASFANAPGAKLYGFELEALKFFPLGDILGGPRRFVASANYTYSKSKLEVTEGDLSPVFGAPNTPATDLFVDGAPMTGQSKHIANLEVGFENPNRLSQQTLLLNYASKRVTNRGAGGQPDIIEKPGVTLDVVLREGVRILNRDIELKLEGRNLTRRRYEEFQESGSNKVFYNRYRVGTVFTVGASMKL